jgi:hypothetical protein
LEEVTDDKFSELLKIEFLGNEQYGESKSSIDIKMYTILFIKLEVFLKIDV